MKPSSQLRQQASFPRVIDSSILLTVACPTKFFYQYCLNLSPVKKSIHLHAGGAFAHAVETTRRAFYLEKKPLDIALYDGWRSLMLYWGDYNDVPSEGTGSYKDFANISAAFFDYFRNYDPRSDHIQPYVKHDGSPAVEFTFSIPLPIMHPDSGEPIIYAGRCDMIGLYSSSACIVDEKTSYSFSTEWASNFAMRGQFLGYTWAAQQFEMPVNMCVVRGIAIQQKSIKHLEAILQFPQWQIERWHSEMIDKIHMLVSYWDNNEFPMNYGDICSAYGGCPMMDLCQVQEPENWISSFETRVWNPLTKDVKDAA